MLQRPARFLIPAALVLVAACDRGTDVGNAAADEAAPTEANGGEAAAAHVDSSSVCGAVEGEWRVDTDIAEVDGARVLVATVCAGEGFHSNTEYPRWGVQVADDAPVAAGAAVSKDEAVEFADQHVTFHVPIDGEGAGDVNGRVRFSVCNDEACLNPTADVSWTVATAE